MKYGLKNPNHGFLEEREIKFKLKQHNFSLIMTIRYVKTHFGSFFR